MATIVAWLASKYIGDGQIVAMHLARAAAELLLKREYMSMAPASNESSMFENDQLLEFKAFPR